MLASVFAMQACGILAASVVSLVIVSVIRAQNPVATPQAVDHIWRWIMGLGLIPASFAVFVRLSIPESPRYTLDVLDDPYKAFEEANRFNDSNLQDEFNQQANRALVNAFLLPKSSESVTNGTPLPSAPENQTRWSPPFLQPEEGPAQYTIRDYFWRRGNWRYLLGTALSWFLLDFAFYGLGLTSPKAISKVWYNGVSSSSAVPWGCHFRDFENKRVALAGGCFNRCYDRQYSPRQRHRQGQPQTIAMADVHCLGFPPYHHRRYLPYRQQWGDHHSVYPMPDLLLLWA
jgi:PHS family inorganic phosphate transporter-like MFS transporter